MLDSILEVVNKLIYIPDEGMVHPGLPAGWVAFIFISMLLIGLRYAFFYSEKNNNTVSFKHPFFTQIIKPLITRPWLIVSLRLIAATVFFSCHLRRFIWYSDS